MSAAGARQARLTEAARLSDLSSSADLVERYAPEHHFRLQVKPGITGPMQVYGRGELTFDERLAVEREYVENLSLMRDIRIVLMTLPVVFGRRGAF